MTKLNINSNLTVRNTAGVEPVKKTFNKSMITGTPIIIFSHYIIKFILNNQDNNDFYNTAGKIAMNKHNIIMAPIKALSLSLRHFQCLAIKNKS